MLVRFRFDGAQGFEFDMPCPPRVGELVHHTEQPSEVFQVEQVFWIADHTSKRTAVADVYLIRHHEDPRDRLKDA